MNIKITIISLLQSLRKKQTVKQFLAPEKLPPDAMAKVMQEVEFLRSKHSVDVRALKVGEIPTIPKRADE